MKAWPEEEEEEERHPFRLGISAQKRVGWMVGWYGANCGACAEEEKEIERSGRGIRTSIHDRGSTRSP